MEYKLRKQIRQLFREYMFKHEINQTQLAQQLGIHRSVVSQIINENVNISLDRLEEYCEKLGIMLKIQVEYNNMLNNKQFGGENNG